MPYCLAMARAGAKPAAPGWNPVENIREHFRANKLRDSLFDTIHRRRWTNIVDRRCTAWTWVMATPDRIRSLATTPRTKTAKTQGARYQSLCRNALRALNSSA